MSSYYINGGKPLEGEVMISGSKNAALGIIAAAMLLDGPCVIENAPHISDVSVLLSICRDLGATVTLNANNSLTIDPRSITTCEAVSTKVRSIRASYYLQGALLGRFHKAVLSLPGGCNFGTRPIDQHVKGFEAMGVSVSIAHGNIEMSADTFHGDHIYLDIASVGATINLMIAAVKAQGVTVIENAAREPHIVDVANFLNTMGANIKGAGTDVIRITGVEILPGGPSYSIIPDQIEAGTYMIAAAATRGNVVVRNIIPKHMEPLSVKLEEMGVQTQSGDDWFRVWTDGQASLSKTTFKTLPYPGFPTDLQPQTTVLLCTATGISRMYENVWENRFQYVDELKLMGADISVAERVALISGPCQLTGARIMARDLRAGAAMVLAGLVANGETEVYNIEVIERGYEHLVEKFTALGADIRAVYDQEKPSISF
ncbi:MAG: UDP-N-acetylglucosamine 1-carboxyvinyltransferase [Oscillospiraceae bacterium]|nr:UDP-N-acetylglucosamine 1-carboxyvinyltransferase [Oscillospiraceae bacterium]MDD4367661.1 UDP-N-acetylglucosamine 1-carboxyvinyltransferase [Oscillospiraceae bacterium]